MSCMIVQVRVIFSQLPTTTVFLKTMFTQTITQDKQHTVLVQLYTWMHTAPELLFFKIHFFVRMTHLWDIIPDILKLKSLSLHSRRNSSCSSSTAILNIIIDGDNIPLYKLLVCLNRVQKTWCPLVRDKLFCLWDKCEFVFSRPKDKLT